MDEAEEVLVAYYSRNSKSLLLRILEKVENIVPYNDTRLAREYVFRTHDCCYLRNISIQIPMQVLCKLSSRKRRMLLGGDRSLCGVNSC